MKKLYILLGILAILFSVVSARAELGAGPTGTAAAVDGGINVLAFGLLFIVFVILLVKFFANEKK